MSSARSIPLDDPLWSLAWYMRGYFPLYDLLNRFYWERLPERAFLPINDLTAARAKKILRRAGRPFTIVANQHFDQCITHLQNPRIKEFSWVRPEVVRIYRALKKHKLLLTLEALDAKNQLVGGLIAIILPGVLIAETMFTLVPNASKTLLCHLVLDLHEKGFAFMDVQTRHDRDPWGNDLAEEPNHSPHPCVRLGEEVWPITLFMPHFERTLSPHGLGHPPAWLEAATKIAAAEKEFLAGDPAPALRLSDHSPTIPPALRWLSLHLDPHFLHAAQSNP